MTDIKKITSKLRIGILIFLFAVVSFLIMLNIAYQTAVVGHAQCSLQYLGCTVVGHFPVESFFGLGALAVVAAAGLFIDRKERQMIAIRPRLVIPKNLEPDEKKLLEMITENDAIFQSELVEKSGVNKVKVTRILDKLEAKGLVERRRRGMTNVVMVKNPQ